MKLYQLKLLVKKTISVYVETRGVPIPIRDIFWGPTPPGRGFHLPREGGKKLEKGGFRGTEGAAKNF